MKKKHKSECELEAEDSNLSSWTRTPNIVANIEIKISTKYVKSTKKGRSLTREYVKYCDEKKYEEKREKSDRERDSRRRES